MSILILEDDPFISIDACEAIAELGFEAIPAYDCATAVGFIQTQACKGALLDFDLNGDNSIEVARLLEAHETPYCFVTGRSIEEIVEASGLQATVYTKPANYAEIAQALVARQ